MAKPGSQAPEIVGVDFAKTTLLAFFETDCPTCLLTLPYLNKLHQFAADAATVIAISQDSRCATDEAVAALALELPVHLDEGLTASKAYDPVAVPTLFLIDAKGQIAGAETGFNKDGLNALAKQFCELAGLDPIELAAEHDGNPPNKPGCMSRHHEPQTSGDGPSAAHLYATVGKRATRVTADEGVDPYEFCFEQGFADALPVVPPTVERVERMLAGTDLPPEQIIAHVPTNFAPATVEKIAANAVMAGCFPALMRVLIPLVRAVCDERLNIHGVQGTTHFAAPLTVVNGPVRDELGFAYGSNVFSNVSRANSTLGRALNLILRNLGGAKPGEIDMSTMGNPGRFSFVIAENEEASPWGQLCADFGVNAGYGAVTLFCAEPPRPISEHTARTPEVLLKAFTPVLANLWSHRTCGRSEALVIVGPEHAATLKGGGFTKADVINFLFENTGIPVSEFKGDDGGEGTQATKTYREITIDGVRCYAKFRARETIRVMVAGGPAGKFSAVLGSWATGPRGSQMVSYPID